ncbi:hypothetical protein [Pseudoxanthomonas suwonensis]|uniref:hypothetical protein n=1 Tax=Pseudoxanthomonas suwonensis TaxID=314722 RepID=UPI0012DC66FC|nr:hypothetical protein [Pseudoxanthomonas suwonensis]
MKVDILIATVILTGCVSTYQSPRHEGPTATIVLSADEASVGGVAKADLLRIQTFSDDKCSVNADGTNLAQFSLLARGDDLGGTTKQVPAGQPFILSFFHYAGVYGSRQCTITYSFMPVQGESYRAHFTRHGNQCNVSLTSAAGLPVHGVRQIIPGCSK